MVIVFVIVGVLLGLTLNVMVYHYRNQNQTVKNNIDDSIWVTFTEKNLA